MTGKRLGGTIQNKFLSGTGLREGVYRAFSSEVETGSLRKTRQK